MPNERKVVFFDGVCGFCNKSVDFLFKVDDDEQLRFAPLQGEFARKTLPDKCRDDMDTIVFLEDGELHYRTTALLRIARVLGGIWLVFYPLIALPERWRDAAYQWFAARRYRFFGKRESCRMPSLEERARFLD